MKKTIILSLNLVLLCTLVFGAIPRPKNATPKNVKVVKLNGKSVDIPIRNK